MQNLNVSFQIALYRIPYGSNFRTVNFIWKLPENDTENDESSHCRAILTVTDQLPTFHSRQMQKDFTDKYKNSVKASVSMLQVMYQDLTGDSSAAVSIAQKQRREDIAKFLSDVDDEPNIFLDLRQLNGNRESSKFDEFWQETDVLFIEYQVVVHDGRHGTLSYLPFAVSIRELI